MPDFKNLIYVNGVWVPQGYPGLSSLTTGQVLRSTSATTAAFGAIDLTNANAVSGALPVNCGGTGVTAIPSFSVNKNGVNQTGIVTNTFTKVTWGTKVFDTNNNFASDKFTPTIAGKYIFTIAVLWNNTTSSGIELLVALYKNGTIQLDNRLITPVANQFEASNMVVVLNANGSTDYFEIYVRHQDSANRDIYGGIKESYWMGAWIAP